MNIAMVPTENVIKGLSGTHEVNPTPLYGFRV